MTDTTCKPGLYCFREYCPHVGLYVVLTNLLLTFYKVYMCACLFLGDPCSHRHSDHRPRERSDVDRPGREGHLPSWWSRGQLGTGDCQGAQQAQRIPAPDRPQPVWPKCRTVYPAAYGSDAFEYQPGMSPWIEHVFLIHHVASWCWSTLMNLI